MPADAAPSASQIAAVCQKRPHCSIVRTTAAGSGLDVLQAIVGGCSEYWLSQPNTAARQVLKNCKGGGTVTVSQNRLTHRQAGTGEIAWERTVAYSLSPWRAVSERGCSYHTGAAANGTATDIDYAALLVRSVDRDSTSPGPAACPVWPASFGMAPAPGLRGGYNVPAPILDKEALDAKGGIGDCVPAMTTAGENGFLTRGTAAASDKIAEIRVLAESANTLLIQVHDPIGDHASRVELWFPSNGDLARIGVSVSGPASAPSEKKDVLPSVERWPATDMEGRKVTVMRLSWADQSTLFSGMAIAYSQAEGGKPARAVANTGIVNDRPAYLPKIVSFADSRIVPVPGVCKLRDGRLMRAD
ncbi:MAG: hypothetical protein JSR24_10825 [Proteobacteria bacterium]|nr:hypothetical protein [Pseudomonadota bacterium]